MTDLLKTVFPPKTSFCRGIITKRHNSSNTDPSVPNFLPHVHCLMVNVWCKCEQNRTKAIKVNIKQKPYLLMESQNDGHAENSISHKTSFCGVWVYLSQFLITHALSVQRWLRCDVNLNKIGQKLSKLKSEKRNCWRNHRMTEWQNDGYVVITRWTTGGYDIFRLEVLESEGLEVHAFCGTGDENIMPTCREAGN